MVSWCDAMDVEVILMLYHQAQMQKIAAFVKGTGPEAEAGAVLRELFKNVKQPTPSPSPALNTRSTPAPTPSPATRPSYPTVLNWLMITVDAYDVVFITFNIFVNIV